MFRRLAGCVLAKFPRKAIFSSPLDSACCLIGSPVTSRQAPAQRICSVQYEIPAALRLSAECVDLLRLILVGNPAQRITIPGILAHPWFQRHLPIDLQVRRSPVSVSFRGPLGTTLCSVLQRNLPVDPRRSRADLPSVLLAGRLQSSTEHDAGEPPVSLGAAGE